MQNGEEMAIKLPRRKAMAVDVTECESGLVSVPCIDQISSCISHRHRRVIQYWRKRLRAYAWKSLINEIAWVFESLPWEFRFSGMIV